jgi:hypothetical protein
LHRSDGPDDDVRTEASVSFFCYKALKYSALCEKHT